MNADLKPNSGAITAPDIETVLSLHDLTVSVRTEDGPQPLIQNISFDLRRGETLALAGRKRVGQIHHFARNHGLATTSGRQDHGWRDHLRQRDPDHAA